jgi:hypothetical protein
MSNGTSRNVFVVFLGRVVFFLVGLLIASMIASTGFMAHILKYNYRQMVDDPLAALVLWIIWVQFIIVFSLLPALFVTAICSKRKNQTPTPFIVVGGLVGVAGAAAMLLQMNQWGTLIIWWWIFFAPAMAVTGALAAFVFWWIVVRVGNLFLSPAELPKF